MSLLGSSAFPIRQQAGESSELRSCGLSKTLQFTWKGVTYDANRFVVCVSTRRFRPRRLLMDLGAAVIRMPAQDADGGLSAFSCRYGNLAPTGPPYRKMAQPGFVLPVLAAPLLIYQNAHWCGFSQDRHWIAL